MAEPLSQAFIRFLNQNNLSLDADYMRQALHTLAQALMEFDVAALTRADRHERTGERQTYRNGYRKRTWRTGAGKVALHIPKLRTGTYYPNFIAPITEQTLRNFAMQIFAEGVHSEAVAGLLNELGFSDLHSSDIADLSQRLDDLVRTACDIPLPDHYAEVELEVLPVQIERNGRKVERQLALAVGENQHGERQLLARQLVTRTDERFWTEFLHDLERRGVRDIQRVVTDAYSAQWAAQTVFERAFTVSSALNIVPFGDYLYCYMPYAA